MLSTPTLEKLINDVSQYVDSYIRSSIFISPLQSNNDKMIIDSKSMNDSKEHISIKELKFQTKQ